MSSFLAVLREEMEMISRNAEGARKAGRPQSHQGSRNICEAKFTLRLGSVDEPRSFFGWAHDPGPNSIERAVESEGVKNVAGGSQRVTAVLQLTQVCDRSNLQVRLGRKPGHYREGDSGRWRSFRDTTSALNL